MVSFIFLTACFAIPFIVSLVIIDCSTKTALISCVTVSIIALLGIFSNYMFMPGARLLAYIFCANQSLGGLNPDFNNFPTA